MPTPQAVGGPAPILILDCYLEERPASLDVFLPPPGVPFEVIAAARSPLETIPTSAAGFSAIVITGSAAHLLDKPAWSERLATLIQSAAHHTVPTFGVCFGHQLIAYALFGETAVRRSKTPEYGWKDIELCFDDAPLTRAVTQAGALSPGSATTFRCFTSHKDEIVPHFPGCEALRFTARSATCAVESFEHRTLPMAGIQFHPELPQTVCTELLGIRSAQHPELGLDLSRELERRADTTALWHELRAPAFIEARRAA